MPWVNYTEAPGWQIGLQRRIGWTLQEKLFAMQLGCSHVLENLCSFLA